MPVINTGDIDPREMFPGAHARLVHGDKMTVAHWHFDADSPLPEHSHPHEQITNMLTGEFEMVIDGVTHILKAGDVCVIPSDPVHSGRAITDCRIMDVWAPAREDYK